jgi:hypothetical protein
MAMSSIGIFVYVEGHEDRSFYDSICRAAGVTQTFEIRTAREVLGSGGKQTLIGLYRYLEKAKALVERNGQVPTAALFFLDKDVDERRGLTVSSDHVCYTEHYCYENYLFIHGDLITAATNAAGLDRPSVEGVFDPVASWRARCIATLREWIVVCLFVVVRGIRYNKGTFGVISAINTSGVGALDPALHQQEMVDLESHSGLTSRGFRIVYGRVEKDARDVIASGLGDTIFSGKWYLRFAEMTIRTAAGGRAYDSNGLDARLVSCLRMTVDYSAPWAVPLRASVVVVAAKL